MGLLDGKVAIITGAGGGIGREHALAFAREGAKVVVNDVGVARDGGNGAGSMAQAVVDELTAAGGEAVAEGSSVATREGADSLVWTALSRFGRLDIVVNNAGILRDRTILNMREEDWDAVQQVHLRGSFLVTQAAARCMRQQGEGGRIINTTSVSGFRGNFGQANYAAAKLGVAALTLSCARELSRYGITVNALAPVALTRMTEDLPLMDGVGVDTMGPQFIAPAAVFLASELSRGITGKFLGVEGDRLFEYRIDASAGVNSQDGRPWTPEAIAERWTEICAGHGSLERRQ